MEPRDYFDATNWADELFWYHLDCLFFQMQGHNSIACGKLNLVK